MNGVTSLFSITGILFNRVTSLLCITGVLLNGVTSDVHYWSFVEQVNLGSELFKFFSMDLLLCSALLEFYIFVTRLGHYIEVDCCTMWKAVELVELT